MKKITINPGRRLSVSSIVVGYLQENKAEQIAFEIPEEFKDYGRKACFEANGETFAKTFDNITGDTLTFTRDMTQYSNLRMTIAFFKVENEDEIVARTSTLDIKIENAVICDDDVKPDDPKVIILDKLIDEVTKVGLEVGEKGDYANLQGNYAKEQGDYAKSQGDYAKEQKIEVVKANEEANRIINNFETNVGEYTTSFNENANNKTTDFDSNAESKTSYFNQNVDNKISEYNNNASEKLSAYNTNAENKKNEFDTNVANKTKTFNDNASSKLESYNQNDTTKTNTFNDNATNKTNAFNSNANSKTETYNNNHTEKLNAYNTNATSKLNDYNTNASEKFESYNTNANSKLEEYNTNATNKIEEYDLHSEELNNKIVSTRNELERVKNDVLETGTDTDTYIHLEDSAMAEYQELSVDGVCEQETTSGKNLLNNNIVSTVKNGLTITRNEDGSILINGTATADVNLSVNYFKFEDGKNYRMSGCPTGGSSSTYYMIHNLANWNTDYGNGVTINGKGQTAEILISIKNGVVCNNLLFKPMIEEGTVKTSYEPYTGGKPSPSPEFPQPISTIENSLKITSCNKNIFNFNETKNLNKYKCNYKYENDILELTQTSQWAYVSCDIKVKPNTTYVYSFEMDFEGINRPSNWWLSLNDTKGTKYNKNFVSFINDKIYKIFNTTNSNTLQILFTGSTTTIPTKTIFKNIQLEENPSLTDFEQNLLSKIEAKLPEGEFIGKINDTCKDTLKVEYNEEDGQYHLNLYKRVYKNNSYNGESYNYYISTTARKDGNIECGELQTGQVVYYVGDETIIDLGIVDIPITYNETTNLFTDSDLMPTINAKYYRNFITTVQNLQVNEKALKQELTDINTRLTALETAQANVVESEEEANDIQVQ